MSTRRIARELAVILLPQLPKDKDRFERLEIEKLASKAVFMLTDYAKQCLDDANAFLNQSQQLISEEELLHPDNETETQELKSVPVTTAQLRQHLDLMERALHLTAEALDVPQMAVDSKDASFLYTLISTYAAHRREVDHFISQAKAKWKLERMVSIDRDILRLACTEAFFISDVPVNVCISEAVGLSHRFADERAAKFINGILADLSDEAKYYRNQGKFRQSQADEPNQQDEPVGKGV